MMSRSDAVGWSSSRTRGGGKVVILSWCNREIQQMIQRDLTSSICRTIHHLKSRINNALKEGRVYRLDDRIRCQRFIGKTALFLKLSACLSSLDLIPSRKSFCLCRKSGGSLVGDALINTGSG